METNITDKKKRARKRVEELKGFYGHLMAYLTVNLMITTVKIVSGVSNGMTFSVAFLDFGAFSIWFFWGIGLFFHSMKVFNFNPFFGKEWEKRQIQKYMDQSRQEADKYKQLAKGQKKERIEF